MDLERKVAETIEREHMIERGGHVVAAISGGADSACLLRVLGGLSASRNFTLEALHVHHGLRGQEADRDEAFVRELCGELGVPLTVRHERVREYAADHRMSEEEAGRVLRYRDLREIAAARSGERGLSAPAVIATAHHRDDSAETILYNLFRGSGLKGLGGIRPASEGIIRPLIGVSRREIEAWMSGHGYGWCEDSTNRETAYARNRIRREILPRAEEINGGAAANIVRAGGFLAKADEYLERQADAVCRGHWFREGEALGIPAWTLAGEPEILKTYAVRRMLREAGCPLRDVGAVHLEAAAALIGGAVGKETDFPGGFKAWNGYEAFFVGRKIRSGEKALPRLKYSVFSLEKGMEIPKNQYTKWFDYDKMKGVPFLRFRRTGDYFTLPGGGRKSLKAYMIDEKIPREERDRIPVLAEGSHVVWLVGYRISEYYKVTAQTKQILEATVDGGES